MMTSDGSGIHADSIAISKAMPAYPVVEITVMMKKARELRIFSTMRSRSIPASHLLTVRAQRHRWVVYNGELRESDSSRRESKSQW